MREPLSFTVVIPFDFVLMLGILLLVALTGTFVAIRKLRACVADLGGVLLAHRDATVLGAGTTRPQ